MAVPPAAAVSPQTVGAPPGSEDRLRLVIEATSDGVWDWNLQTGEMFFSAYHYAQLIEHVSPTSCLP